MYALVIPPELVARLDRLREHHARGPIRRQILKAVEYYLDAAEQEMTKDPDPAPECPQNSDPPRRPHTRQSARS